MLNRRTLLLSAGIMLIALFSLGACQHAGTVVSLTATSSATPLPSLEVSSTGYPTTISLTASATATSGQPTSEAYPHPGIQETITTTTNPYPLPGMLSPTPTTKVTLAPYPGALASATQVPEETTPTEETLPTQTPTPSATVAATEAYPGPGSYPTLTQAYPGPYITSTQMPYPGPRTPTSSPNRTPVGSKTPTSTHGSAPIITITGTVSSPTPQIGSPELTATPLETPIELPPPQPVSPPPAGSSVIIWHSWNGVESDAMKEIIQSFQRIYPDVTFTLQYIPPNDLFNTYYQSAYLGTGPSLLLGPAEWGVKLFDSGLITNLSPYVPAEFLTDIYPAARASGEYHSELISLPLSQHGVVMFRNSSIIESAPETFNQLTELSQEATRAGIVGTYLERGAFFSAAELLGLGGRMMDEQGFPAFDDSTGRQWLDLLADYDQAGAVTFNTNLDLNMFKRGRVGIIIDGTWNITSLQEAIGAENLAIDAWPTYGSGHMTGWVQADSIFLNTNTTGDNRFAALAFMGYLLDPDVQMLLAEVGHIPSVSTTQPRNPLIQEAMVAFSYGVPYPISFDDSWLQYYWSELNRAIQSVFVEGISPESALNTARDNLNSELNSLSATP
jgi:ABC-type glycerol-3-phosphate transport system substrate-binding protein